MLVERAAAEPVLARCGEVGADAPGTRDGGLAAGEVGLGGQGSGSGSGSGSQQQQQQLQQQLPPSPAGCWFRPRAEMRAAAFPARNHGKHTAREQATSHCTWR